jgi:aspartate aminotransferase
VMFFQDVPLAPEDAILSLTAKYHADPRVDKVNLGVGSYKTGAGHPYVLPSVVEAEKRILGERLDKEYLPIAGSTSFVKHTHDLIFGVDSPVKEQTCGVQTVGGSGALRIGGEFLAGRQMKLIYLSQPSWSNHEGIFTRAGMVCKYYPYYDNRTHQVDFDSWCRVVGEMEPQTVILLHTCCHNPTGMDPTKEQWRELSKLLLKKQIFPFFDMAYQGFDMGLEQDAWPIRYFASQGHALFVATSYSKNMGLYSERVGGLFSVAPTKAISDKIGSQLRVLIRGNYSTPPAHGARIVSTILQNSELRHKWDGEVAEMRERIKKMRELLASKLGMMRPDLDFDFINEQRGIFSYSGLNASQVQVLISQYGLYMPPNGRINIAGLNEGNIDYVANAFAAVL